MTFQEALAVINGLPGFSEKHTIPALQARLEELGSPDAGLKIIHVAGTNGKGSVCNYLSEILQRAGYHVGLFTSPHLVDIRERIRLDGAEISEADFARLTGQLSERLQSPAGTPAATYFEFLLLVALLYYAERRPDYLILECGLGGRLDPTNAVREVALSVITHIARDHTQYLGETIPEIAAEKAGILRPGTPAVYLREAESAPVIERRAREVGALLTAVETGDVRREPAAAGQLAFSCKSRYDDRYDVRLQTQAEYQIQNAVIAITAAEVLGISRSDIEWGLFRAHWPGRMEQLQPGFYVDGAHNADGVRVFLQSVERIPLQGARRLIFAAAADKQVAEELSLLRESGLFAEIAFTGYDSPRAVPGETMAERYLAQENGTDPACAVEYYDDSASAFQALMARHREGDLLFAAGSLYLVGEMKKYDQF
ncbi:MAG: bifunctional folylpolyglutamate synthase/dihydrofolate synthase [Butyrivibrio sp.]|nr:bifunctional folylpolyglutamate synthase/dihydrofolate synthase [Butyrivibrio sp.]